MRASAEVHQAAQEVVVAATASLADALNGFIAKFVGWPFTAAPGFVVDEDGNRTDAFVSVVHTTPAKIDGPNAGGFPADGVAAVIDASERLDLEGLRAAYARIVRSRQLKKRPAPSIKGTTPTTTVTLGIILAQRSDLPLETLGEELDRLNAATPGRERPDLLVVASTGVINYGVQFPGEGVSADFLPPGEGALEAFTPAMYIVMVMRPSGAHSLNKMIAFLIAHLEIFSPGARVPRGIEVLEGVTANVVTLWGYQFNLAGDLVRVPERFYNDRYMAPLPVRIEDQQGNLLGLLRFLPWQDGAAILLENSKLPLDGLLVFLGADALKRGGIIRLKASQISYVLPITAEDFGRFLVRLQKQSNMVVRSVQPDWTIQKVADEGSSSPFMARLMIGVLRLRDNVFDATNRDDFDKPYDFVLKSLFSARDAMRQMTTVWKEHERKVAAGEIARVERTSIHVDVSVDRELGQEAEAFINAAARAVKKGMQDVATVFGVNIGFLFQKQAAFDAGIASLHASDPALAEYLRLARTVWSEMLQDARNAVEHEGWTLPRVIYTRTADRIMATEPEIRGMNATEFAAFVFDRLACFVEDVTAHLLKQKLPTLMGLAELTLTERPEGMPERFRLTLATGGMPLWVIAFHVSTFEQT
jgi:hypothetical protein